MAKKFIQKILDNIQEAKKTDKVIVFTIASTSKQESKPFLTPFREYKKFCILGCVLFNQKLLNEIIELIDKEVDYVLVDAEKKIPLHAISYAQENIPGERTIGNFETGNFSKICFKSFKHAKVFEYKPNDLTVNAAWMFISQRLHSFTGKKISILGMGNIGSKLALKSVECGADVHVYSKDFFKTHLITQALNLIKPIGTIASITCHRDLLSTTFSSDIVIGATNGIPIISSDIISSLNKNAIVVDLGKNNITDSAIKLSKEYGLEICRTDVTSSIENFVLEMLSLSYILDKDYGHKKIEKTEIVGGGYFGNNGSIIVDSINKPKRIYGVADGKGSIKKELNSEDEVALTFISKKFNINL